MLPTKEASDERMELLGLFPATPPAKDASFLLQFCYALHIRTLLLE
jgi:hypothetical protein